MKYQDEPGTRCGLRPVDPSAPRRVSIERCVVRYMLPCVLPVPPSAPADAHIRDAYVRTSACSQVGVECFRMCRELVDGVVLVPTDATCAAIKDVFEDTRSILEPAGALAVAGAKAYLAHHNLNGKKVSGQGSQ